MTIDRRQQYLTLLGVQAWTLRRAPNQNLDADVGCVEDTAQLVADFPKEPKLDTDQFDSPLHDESDWKTLRQRVMSCTACGLHEGRTQAVFGVGSESAQWLIIGEAPGAEEDRQGEPFVGRAGQLLNNMLLAIGLNRESVYIANILKCRPPNNRDPRPEEIVKCQSYLLRQIRLLQPKIILVVGRIAAQNLLMQQESLARMRGKIFRFAETDIPVVVTYHPAYLLRSPRDKAKAWQDLQLAKSALNHASVIR